jgi:hypothetical protein
MFGVERCRRRDTTEWSCGLTRFIGNDLRREGDHRADVSTIARMGEGLLVGGALEIGSRCVEERFLAVTPPLEAASPDQDQRECADSLEVGGFRATRVTEHRRNLDERRRAQNDPPQHAYANGRRPALIPNLASMFKHSDPERRQPCGVGSYRNSEMAVALVATWPDPSYRQQLMTFGRFIGSWDVEVTDYHDDGSTETGSAEWHFGWTLNGRAIQDVWIAPSRDEQQRLGVRPREWGTAVRFYEPDSDTWRMVWSGPYRARQILFIAHEDGDRIVIEGEEEPGKTLNWIFSEIKPDSFHWHAVVLEPDGSRRKVQEMAVRRAHGSASCQLLSARRLASS